MRFVTKNIEELSSDTLICFIFEDNDEKSELFKYLDNLSNGQLSEQIFDYKSITGKFQETFKFSINKNRKNNEHHI